MKFYQQCLVVSISYRIITKLSLDIPNADYNYYWQFQNTQVLCSQVFSNYQKHEADYIYLYVIHPIVVKLKNRNTESSSNTSNHNVKNWTASNNHAFIKLKTNPIRTTGKMWHLRSKSNTFWSLFHCYHAVQSFLQQSIKM